MVLSNTVRHVKYMFMNIYVKYLISNGEMHDRCRGSGLLTHFSETRTCKPDDISVRLQIYAEPTVLTATMQTVGL